MKLEAKLESCSSNFASRAKTKRCQPVGNLGSSLGQPGVILGSTWGQPGVQLGSNWGQSAPPYLEEVLHQLGGDLNTAGGPADYGITLLNLQLNVSTLCGVQWVVSVSD